MRNSHSGARILQTSRTQDIIVTVQLPSRALKIKIQCLHRSPLGYSLTDLFGDLPYTIFCVRRGGCFTFNGLG